MAQAKARSPWQARAEFRDPGFAERFAGACLNRPGCPDLGQGRARWFAEQFQAHFGAPVSAKTVRLWGQGHRPVNEARLKQLTTVLRVDAAWLYFGDEHHADPNRGGILNIVAGLIQLDGGTVSPPTGDRDSGGAVNLRAVIMGVSHGFHITTGERARPGLFRFTVPSKRGEAIVLGVLRDALTFRLVRIPPERIDEGCCQGSPTAIVELTASDVLASKVDGFTSPF